MAETILFTGFPGFIGMRLLPRILELKPHARIECLVQEKFLGAARQAVATLEGKHGHAPDEPSVSGGLHPLLPVSREGALRTGPPMPPE